MRKSAFLIGYGLLPFWAAIVFVTAGSLLAGSSEYWLVAPWFIIVSIPMCGVTFLIAGITLVVQKRTTGDSPRKDKIAARSFWALNLVVAAAIGMWWIQSAMRESVIENEKKLALAFVQAHESVIEQAGRNAQVSLSASHAATNALPVKYEFSIDTKRQRDSNPSSRYVHAIVSVSGPSESRRFNLDCITVTSMGYRDPFKDPCKQ